MISRAYVKLMNYQNIEEVFEFVRESKRKNLKRTVRKLVKLMAKDQFLEFLDYIEILGESVLEYVNVRLGR